LIRGLRTAHRWIWLLLALLLPVFFLLALQARQERPLQELQPVLAPAAQPADDTR